jgi:hypothetical protein
VERLRKIEHPDNFLWNCGADVIVCSHRRHFCLDTHVFSYIDFGLSIMEEAKYSSETMIYLVSSCSQNQQRKLNLKLKSESIRAEDPR